MKNIFYFLFAFVLLFSCEDDTVIQQNDSEEEEQKQESIQFLYAQKYRPVNQTRFEQSEAFNQLSESSEIQSNSIEITGTLLDSLLIHQGVEFYRNDTIFYTFPYEHRTESVFYNLHIKERAGELSIAKIKYTLNEDDVTGYDMEIIPFSNESEIIVNGLSGCHEETILVDIYYPCPPSMCWDLCTCYELRELTKIVCDGGGSDGGGGGDNPNGGGGGPNNGGDGPPPGDTFPLPPNDCSPSNPLNGDLDGSCQHDSYEICLLNGNNYCWTACDEFVPSCSQTNIELRQISELLDTDYDIVECLRNQSTEVLEYLQNGGDEDLVIDFSGVLCEIPNARFYRFLELNDLLVDDPDALLRDCFDDTDEYQIEFWSDLATFTPNQDVIDRVESEGEDWDIQEIQNANGRRVNLDYFAVKVTEFGDIDGDGQTDTPLEFFEYWRQNINEFVDTDNSEFRYYETPQDSLLWHFSDPLTTIMNININTFGPFGDDGAVICSDYCYCSDGHWIFTTLKGPRGSSQDTPGLHPVSGNRQFGYSQNADGSYNFYTQGADRTSNPVVGFGNSGIGGSQGFAGADRLWESLQEGIRTKVDTTGGQAEILDPIKKRPNWNKVREKLIQDEVINSIECE